MNEILFMKIIYTLGLIIYAYMIKDIEIIKNNTNLFINETIIYSFFKIFAFVFIYWFRKNDCEIKYYDLFIYFITYCFFHILFQIGGLYRNMNTPIKNYYVFLLLIIILFSNYKPTYNSNNDYTLFIIETLVVILIYIYPLKIILNNRNIKPNYINLSLNMLTLHLFMQYFGIFKKSFNI